ncbi:hypothetical protein DPMN_099440 [Dreissena polymorpha]|uniref:Uncharacterized protein n=1 Tax=Dreissena polymorpha TaxID=45954 RepID=A0A9D4R866_DREPO|nr:hypothetical protein DPMN_099440 [Dreissena polymorpha]
MPNNPLVVCDDGGASDDDSLCSLAGKCGDDFLMIRAVVDVVGCDDDGASDKTGLRSLRRLIGVQVSKFITSCFLQVSLLCLPGASSL